MRELTKLEHMLVNAYIADHCPGVQQTMRVPQGCRMATINFPRKVVMASADTADKVNIELHSVAHWLVGAVGYDQQLKTAVFTIREEAQGLKKA
jgi:hypothetical protein